MLVDTVSPRPVGRSGRLGAPAFVELATALSNADGPDRDDDAAAFVFVADWFSHGLGRGGTEDMTTESVCVLVKL